MRTMSTALALAAVMLLGATAGASADDKIKLAIGQRGNWDTSVSEVGQRAGIFKKHGLELEIVYTQGAGETQQAVISGSVDLGDRGRRHGRAERLFEGRAGARDQRRDDRRQRSLLVCEGGLADQVAEGHRRTRRWPIRPTARRRTASSPRS